jgi:hypothetical protein
MLLPESDPGVVMIYGPFVKLPPGRYTTTWTLALPPGVEGPMLDVAAAVVPVTATHAMGPVTELTFEVPTGDERLYEVRSFGSRFPVRFTDVRLLRTTN